jgi:hypothetical protein
VLQEELPPRRKNEGWVHQARLQTDERIYGLGERASTLNLRAAKDEKQQSKTYRMWNYDAAGKYAPGSDPMYLCIPVYLGLHSAGSYLIFYENSFDANFTFGEIATADFTGGALLYYVSLYTDAGDGYGESRLDRFYLVKSSNNLEIHWHKEGNYSFPYTNVKLHLHGLQLQKAWVDNNEMSIQGQQIFCDRFEKVRLGIVDC